MTSLKQFDANRRNARHSTGPRTEPGKNRSRQNAIRHGLTAETVVHALEDAEDHRAFEATILADYNPRSAVERELVLRLASLLWRLRRATLIETGLLAIQAEILHHDRNMLEETAQEPLTNGHELPDGVVDAAPVEHTRTYGQRFRPRSPIGKHSRRSASGR